MPSSTTSHGAGARCIVDGLGRKLTTRILTALDKLRIFKAAGSELSLNEPWLALAALACSVTSIDDVPVPFPLNELQIEALISRLDDTGIEAIADSLDAVLDADNKPRLANVGNLSGTPN